MRVAVCLLLVTRILGAQQSTDERFASLIPEFGGAYRAPDGGLMVRVTDTTLARSHGPAAARAVVLQELQAWGRSDIKTVQFEVCKYAYSQLQGWMRAVIRDSTVVRGLYSFGIDDRTSRIRFGMADSAAVRRMRAGLEKVGAPADAYTVGIEAPDRILRP